jgi:hypothetical protein
VDATGSRRFDLRKQLSLKVHSLKQRGEFAWRQIAPGTDWQTRNAEGAKPDPAETKNRDSNRIHETAHQVVFPLMDDDLQDEALGRFPQQAHFSGNDEAAVYHDPFAQFLKCRGAWADRGEYMVFLLEPVAWVHDAVGKLPVVGEQQETRRVAVEPAHGIHALGHLHEIHHRPPVTLIAGGSDVSAWFIEEDVSLGLRPNEFAVYPDHCFLGIHLGS